MHDVSVPAAVLAGLISFLSPCVLPLVPPYLVYLTGATIEHVANDEGVKASKRAVMASALMFVLGFSTVFVALGASASFIGGLIRAWSAQLSILAGIVIIIMGLHFLGLTRIGFLMREGRLTAPKPVGLWGAYVMGLAFAFGWTPCIGPILAAILSVAAAEATVTKGAMLLAVYSAGLGIPFLLAAFAIEQFSSLFTRMKQHLESVERAMGVLMVSPASASSPAPSPTSASGCWRLFPRCKISARANFGQGPVTSGPAGSKLLPEQFSARRLFARLRFNDGRQPA